MKITLHFADGEEEVDLKVPQDQVVEAKPKAAPPSRAIEELAAKALSDPVCAPRIRDMPLKDKKVAIMVDDKYRPTPAFKVVPILLEELETAGVNPKEVTFITGTGLHDKMNEEELADKLGDNILSEYNVIPHDAYDHGELRFIGISDLGTPIWINSAVAQADFKIAVGRVSPHGDCGYEGGAKMILPGVSSLESVMHNHSMFRSANAGPGTLEENPGRRDVDDIGGKVGLDFILNFVVSPRGNLVEAFAGHYMAAHRLGVEYGDTEVWGVETKQRADITVALPCEEAQRQGPAVDRRALANAIRGTKVGGTVIFVVSRRDGEAKYSEGPLQKKLASLGLEELFRKADRREWDKPEDWLYMARAMNGAARNYYYEIIVVGGEPSKRELRYIRNVKHVEGLEEAFEEALKKHGSKAQITLLHNANVTLPLEKVHTFKYA